MKTLFSIFTALTLLIIPAKSQESYQEYNNNSNSLKYGFFACINRNTQNMATPISFAQQGTPSFTNGSGYGYDIGMFTEFFKSDPVSLGFRIGFSNTPGEFSYNEIMPAVIDRHTELINLRYNLETKVYTLSVEPFFNIALLEHLSFLGGFRFSYITGTHYKWYESIESGNLTYPNGSRTSDIMEGKIGSTNKLLYSARAGLSYDISLSSDGSIILAPEIFYDYMFNSLIQGASWKISSIAGGIAIKFR